MRYKLTGYNAEDLRKHPEDFREKCGTRNYFDGNHGCWGCAAGAGNGSLYIDNISFKLCVAGLSDGLFKFWTIEQKEKIERLDAMKRICQAIIGNAFKYEVVYENGEIWIHAKELLDQPKRRVMYYMFILKEATNADKMYVWTAVELLKRGVALRRAILMAMVFFTSTSAFSKGGLPDRIELRTSGSSPIHGMHRVGELKKFMQFNQFYGEPGMTYRQQPGGYSTNDPIYKDGSYIQNSIRFPKKEQVFTDKVRNDQNIFTAFRSCHSQRPEEWLAKLIDLFLGK